MRRKLRAKASWNPFGMEYLKGTLRMQEGDEADALEHFQNAERVVSGQPNLFLQLGNTYLTLGNWEEAQRCFVKALELAPDSSEAWPGICRSLLARRHNREAADAAMASIGLMFHNPRTFFPLGTALHRLNELEEAIRP